MSDLKRGLYETLLTENLRRQLDSLSTQLHPELRELDPADLPDRITAHLADVTRRAIEAVPEPQRAQVALTLAQQLLERVHATVEESQARTETPLSPASILSSISSILPDGSPEDLRLPLIPLLDTTLLTNAPGEPRVGSQILEEIDSADRIDVIMAFIRRSGIIPLETLLRRHCEAGRPLRVLTTTFTGTTELEALELLRSLGAQVKVSYDQTSTRLHAKAWLFHRDSGFATAYIGSSNLTRAGQDRGLEWNVRVSGRRNPEVLTKFRGVFESYWNHPDFQDFDPAEFTLRANEARAPQGPTTILSPLDIRLEPFQERLLEQIEVSRARGLTKNLLVSATGTGKTVMAAVDYARLAKRLTSARLLFVAHREEILAQSLATFRQAVKDPAFGELWVGGRRPRHFEHVFASIQSLNANGLKDLAPDHFDVVIVDEFHHAAANSYQTLLEHLMPQQLLGLTATPERSDGLPILEHFGNRIAAELRLWDAIDQHRLTPFDYFGIHDGLDLTDIPWRRGRGYDTQALSNLLTANDLWTRTVINQTLKRAELHPLRALGFCVSVEHAQYMARKFQEAGIPSAVVWSDTSDDERRAALKKLAQGELKALFSVDLFNEGVDVPSINTLLLLRPTDSPVLFLQQLGRGLRRHEAKERCLVLDFVGQHRQEFRFDRKFRALLGGSLSQLRQQIERGFPFLPAGCHMELDAVASELVLENIRESIPTQWNEKVEELRRLSAEQAGREIGLSDYLRATDLEPLDIYRGNRSWSDLQEAAGISLLAEGPDEKALRRACGRMLHIDDPVRIEAYRRFLASDRPPKMNQLADRDRRLLRMLVASVVESAVKAEDTFEDACNLLWSHPQVMREIQELLEVLEEKIEHAHPPLDASSDSPLLIHACYTRIEILAGFGCGGQGARVPRWQTGVYWARDERADLLAFTLDKSSGGFSPSTRYRDFAISRELIHWESQSVTRADSDTGRRYQNHVAMGSHVYLFARPNVDERAFWFLGPAKYVSHESEQPMAITWKLKHPLPGDWYAVMAAAIV